MCCSRVICTLATVSILPVVLNCLMCRCTKVVDPVGLKTIQAAVSLPATVQYIKEEIGDVLGSLGGRNEVMRVTSPPMTHWGPVEDVIGWRHKFGHWRMGTLRWRWHSNIALRSLEGRKRPREWHHSLITDREPIEDVIWWRHKHARWRMRTLRWHSSRRCLDRAYFLITNYSFPLRYHNLF